jgi:hypothetical protein
MDDLVDTSLNSPNDDQGYEVLQAMVAGENWAGTGPAARSFPAYVRHAVIRLLLQMADVTCTGWPASVAAASNCAPTA